MEGVDFANSPAYLPMVSFVLDEVDLPNAGYID